MEKFTIIWDFDGTILPIAPFDSEQSLLLYRMNQLEAPFGLLKKGFTSHNFHFITSTPEIMNTIQETVT